MKRDFPWIRIKSEDDLPSLQTKLDQLYHYNTWSEEHTDKNGNYISLVGYDWKPNSDWGKVDSLLGVWFANQDLYKKGIEVIKKNAHESRISVEV